MGTKNYKGSRWWKIDFHTHTPASKDYHEKTISPEDWLKAAMTARLDAVVVSDHNAFAWIDKLKSAYLDMEVNHRDEPWFRPLVIFPGTEIAVAGNGDRVHLLAIFDPSTKAETINAVLGTCRIYDNFGDDQFVSSEMSASMVVDAVHNAKGIVIPAHLNGARGLVGTPKDSDGKIRLPEDLRKILKNHIFAAEVCNPMIGVDAEVQKILDSITAVGGSDSHELSTLGEHFSWVKMSKLNLESLTFALKDGQYCVKEGKKQDPNKEPEFFIESLEIAKQDKCKDNLKIEFSPHFTSLIGGRGSGKSTVIESLRLACLSGMMGGSVDGKEHKWQKFAADLCSKETLIKMRVQKDGKRYELQWQGDGCANVVYEWNDLSKKWECAEAGNIASRFPVRVLSQKEIHQFAIQPQGLLKMIDADPAVDADGIEREWKNLKSQFVRTRAEIRELEKRQQELSADSAMLKDDENKLAYYEQKGIGTILKEFRKASIAGRALALPEELKQLSGQLREIVARCEIPDFPMHLFDAEAETTKDLCSVYKQFQDRFHAFALMLGAKADELDRDIDAYNPALRATSWAAEYSAKKKAYDDLLKDPKTAGFDQDEYKRLQTERMRLEERLKTARSIAEQIKVKKSDCEKLLVGMNSLRNVLHDKRVHFINSVLQGNQYVRMSLVKYGDRTTIVNDLRKIIGFETDAFGDVFYDEYGNEDDSLLYAFMYLSGKDDDVDIEQKLSAIKRRLVAICHGADDTLHKRFMNSLRQRATEHPFIVDDIETYWPEDRLDVMFKVNGDEQKLSTGSDGQKASAILAFLLSNGKGPIVIDQPEDDLDNALITQLVVERIHSIKQNRQVIVATHNPNIVVNGDSEYVNVMAFDGLVNVGNSGGLEESPIRNEICIIMEGGKDAFRKRFERMISMEK